MSMSQKRRTTTVRISPEGLELLDQFASEYQCTRGSAIRALLGAALSSEQTRAGAVKRLMPL